jgi:thiol-disulfide isomerase/thioredoxin
MNATSSARRTIVSVRSASAAIFAAVVLLGLLTAGVCTGMEKSSVKGSTSAAVEPEPTPDRKPESANPVVQLVRDPQIQTELKLSIPQIQAVDAAYAEIEESLWLSRDTAAGPAFDRRQEAARQFERKLASIFELPQQARLKQLMLQARGWPALSTTEIAGPLQLNATQSRRIEEIIDSTAAQIRKTTLEAGGSDRDLVTPLRKQEGESIQNLLSPAQRQNLAAMVGTAYDLSRVQSLTFHAPELKEVESWINSKPLTMSTLHGKVVAFHFWAFGCINCVHNLPHYNDWHKRFNSRGLVLLGMHTPETQAEHDIAALKDKVQQFKIRYPVAVDDKNQNWKAWANSMWPSVYLVDKRGRVRYWWYGELNWQGAGGEKFMRQKIDELLAERE